MKKTNVKWLALVLSALMVVALVSCSASGRLDSESMNSSDKYYDAPSSAGDYDYAEDEMEMKPSEESADGSMPPVADDAETSSDGKTIEEKIIRTVEINAQTKEFDQVTVKLESMVRELGGYVESSRSNGVGYSSGSRFSRNANYVIRIPAEHLDEFLTRSGELCRVTSSYSNVSNVTATYYDMQSRLETLRAEKVSLQAMLEKAQDIETMLRVQQYLYDVISEIESYETRLRVLDSKVSYSTVTLYLNEVVEYTQEVEEASWGERLGDAFVESWLDFADNFQGFTVWFVNAIPTLLVLGAIAAVVIVLIKKHVNKRRAKREQDKEEKS
jgi:hypothetical protein